MLNKNKKQILVKLLIYNNINLFYHLILIKQKTINMKNKELIYFKINKNKYTLVLFTFFLLMIFSLRGVEPSFSPQTFKNDFVQVKEELSPCVIVIFGATGDLTARKLFPALYHLAQEGQLSEDTVIVGVARKNLTNQMFRDQVGKALDQFMKIQPKDELVWETFKNKIFYHQAEFDIKEGYEQLQKRLSEIEKQYGTQGNRLYYLATQPSYFPFIINQLYQHTLIYNTSASDSPWSRVMIEKPFGTDLESALDLQKQISKCLDDHQVFRIDHYLGKEGVQNLLALRFENRLFESIWNHQYIDNIQITLSEDLGIGTRGNFWEETGALRDFFQNHLMQLLTIVAMEPPQELKARYLHAEKIHLLKAIRPFPLEGIDYYLIRGQYDSGMINGKEVQGYRQEPSVSHTSSVETYVAAKIFIDNERWRGVPFYIRGGKRLPKQITEIAIIFKALPGQHPNILFIRIQPNQGVFFKTSTNLLEIPLKMDEKQSHPSLEAYEKLIDDAIQGNSSLFVEAGEQIEAWQLLTPVLKYWQSHFDQSFPNYQAGSWGPINADKMLQQHGHRWELLEK